MPEISNISAMSITRFSCSAAQGVYRWPPVAGEYAGGRIPSNRTPWDGGLPIPIHGREVQIWLREVHGEMDFHWREVNRDADGGVRIEPAPELEVLRLPPQPIERRALTPRGEQPLENVRGDSLELNLEFELGDAAEVGVTLRVTPDGAERTTLSYDRSAKLLRIDFSRASLDRHLHYASYIFPPGGPNPVVQQQEAPLELAAGEKLRLRVFLDRSMLEVFANERQAMTQRIYPTRPDAQEVQVFARGGSAQVEGTAWQMAPANPW